MPKPKKQLQTNKPSLLPWKKLTGNFLSLSKSARAGYIVDKDGIPQMFIFDTPAFLDLLSTIDDALADSLSHEDYHRSNVNPAGWLIDEIESLLPLNPKFVNSLRESISEADVKGWVPLEEIKRELKI